MPTHAFFPEFAVLFLSPSKMRSTRWSRPLFIVCIATHFGCAPNARPSDEAFASTAEQDDDVVETGATHATADLSSSTESDEESLAKTVHDETADLDDNTDDDDSATDIADDIDGPDDITADTDDALTGFADPSSHPGQPPIDRNMAPLTGDLVEAGHVSDIECMAFDDVQLSGDYQDVIVSEAKVCRFNHVMVEGSPTGYERTAYFMSVYNPTNNFPCQLRVQEVRARKLDGTNVAFQTLPGLMAESARPDLGSNVCLAPQGRGWLVGWLDDIGWWGGQFFDEIETLSIELDQLAAASGFASTTAVLPTNYWVDPQSGRVSLDVKNTGSVSVKVFNANVIGFDDEGKPLGRIVLVPDDYTAAWNLAAGQTTTFSQGTENNALLAPTSRLEAWVLFRDPE